MVGMPDEMKRYWEHKLIECLEREPVFKGPTEVTPKDKLYSKYLYVVDMVYELLTGCQPHEE